MKKKALMLLAVVALTMIAAACTHHTCPAYRGSVVSAEPTAAAEIVMAEVAE